MTDFEITDVELLVGITHETRLDMPFCIVNIQARRLDFDMGCSLTVKRSIEVGNSIQLPAHALQGVIVPAEGIDKLVGVCSALCPQFHVLAVFFEVGNADIVA